MNICMVYQRNLCIMRRIVCCKLGVVQTIAHYRVILA